jgi:hypothetical protein
MKTTHRHYAEELGDFNRHCRFTITHAAYLPGRSTRCLALFAEGVDVTTEFSPAVLSRGRRASITADQKLAPYLAKPPGEGGLPFLLPSCAVHQAKPTFSPLNSTFV